MAFRAKVASKQLYPKAIVIQIWVRWLLPIANVGPERLEAIVSRTKQVSRRKRRCKFGPILGAAGLSLSLAGGVSAATAAPVADALTQNSVVSYEITLDEEEIADCRRTDKSLNFETAPFPYHGAVPDSGQSFLNAGIDGHWGHVNFRGDVLWESQTFSDDRVLLHIPPNFDPKRPAVMVVFFHGHGANLAQDVQQGRRHDHGARSGLFFATLRTASKPSSAQTSAKSRMKP